MERGGALVGEQIHPFIACPSSLRFASFGCFAVNPTAFTMASARNAEQTARDETLAIELREGTATERCMSRPPVVPAGQSPLDTRHRESWGLAAAVAAFVLWPGSIPKFFFLGVALWLGCRVLGPQVQAVGCTGWAATLYATTFLLTPVCASQALRSPDATAVASPLVQLALLTVGCPLGATGHRHRSPGAHSRGRAETTSRAAVDAAVHGRGEPDLGRGHRLRR
ncbi:MAG: hypothetical protein RL514_4023 [Verrucomicrobiota bacterium]|jgi:hypothetical protein